MSGPIVRKYGFPNFEKIFGQRDIKHGAEDEADSTEPRVPDPDSPRIEPRPEAARPKSGPPEVD